MVQNAYLLAKIGADTAENEQHLPKFCRSAVVSPSWMYSIAHHGAGRVLTASRPSRQKVDGIIVEDSGTLGALTLWGPFRHRALRSGPCFYTTRIFKVQNKNHELLQMNCCFNTWTLIFAYSSIFLFPFDWTRGMIQDILFKAVH